MKQLGKTLTGALLGFILAAVMLLPVQVSAAAPADMQFLREAYEASLAQKSGSVVEHFTLLSPYAKAVGNVSLEGTWNPALLVKGEASGNYMTFIGLQKTGQVPFYLEQQPKQLAIYFKLGQAWQKIMAPVDAAEMADMMQVQSVDEVMSLTKDVKMLKTTGNDCTMLVTLDRDKVASLMRAYSAKAAQAEAKNAKKTDKKALAEQQKMMDTICNALVDMDYTWTVDKTTKQSKNVSMDLTTVIRPIAKACLAANRDKIAPDQQEVLDCLIDSCSLKMDAVYKNDGQEAKVVLPKEVQQAKEYKPELTKHDTEAVQELKAAAAK